MNKVRLWVRKLKKYMPKFHHGEQLGFAYKARAVGWRRIPLLNLFPYLTADVIELHLCLKSLIKGQEWQQGILHIEPSVGHLSNDKFAVILDETVFPFVELGKWPEGFTTAPKYQFPVGRWWARTLSIKEGMAFIQPCHFACSLTLENINHVNDKVQMQGTVPIKIAEIEVVSRATFIMWLFTTIIAVAALIIGLLKS